MWWKDTPRVEVDRDLFLRRRAALPKFSYEEQVVLLFALVLITLWFTASPINAFPGWTAHTAPRMDIGSIGMMCTLPLFIVPCGCTLPQARPNPKPNPNPNPKPNPNPTPTPNP